MSIISWNCRGLGNPASIQVLVDLIHVRKSVLVFLMETLVNKRKMEIIKLQVGFKSLFVVDNSGHSGGLALLWKEGCEVDIVSFSRNHMDAIVCLEGEGNSRWRFTGFYGFPERARRKDSWQLLRNLSERSNLPWVVMGDFNDILRAEEKRGRVPHPN